MHTTLPGFASALMNRAAFAAPFLSRAWRRGSVLILCYHGIARWDEETWNPALYVSASRFARRMELLHLRKCTVLPLNEALERLDRNDLPERAVVLTFDDGYYDFLVSAYPVLQAHQYPATVYLTTLRCEHNRPIVRLLISYLLWYRRDTRLDGRGLPGLADDPYRLSSPEEREAIVKRLMDGSSALGYDRHRNDDLARSVAERLAVDYEGFVKSRLLTLMTPAEVTELSRKGVDFQLHTHRHRSPSEPAAMVREIRDNRQRIEAMTGKRPTHFCWPSGVYHRQQLPVLDAEGIKTATTCEFGVAKRGSNRLLLPRFVDTTQISERMFTSWVSRGSA